jgi:hypothetical protein
MQHIKVKKQKLLNILRKNRTAHRKIFLEAQEGFKKAVIEQLEKRLEAARKGQRVDLYIRLNEPVDQTKDYDRAIGMLEMDDNTVILLTELDYKQYVLDDWTWKDQFLHSNAFYSKTASDTVAAMAYSESV